MNTFFKTHRRRPDLVPVEQRHVLDRLHERDARASRSATAAASGRRPTAAPPGPTSRPPGNNKPLTQVTCPSSSICYAVGDRGNALKSTDGGATWSYLHEHRRQPDLRALVPERRRSATRPTSTRTSSRRPTAARPGPGSRRRSRRRASNVPGSGGPNPFAGLMAISCSDANTCVAVGPLRRRLRPDDPEHRPADRHHHRRRRDLDAAQTSNAGTGNYLHAISCLPGTTTCTAVGRGGTIVTTTDLVDWTPATSRHDEHAEQRHLPEHVVLHGRRPERHGRRLQRRDVDGDHRQRRHRHARRASPAVGHEHCYATGKQGVTIATTNGGATLDAAGRRRHDAADERRLLPDAHGTCFAVGNAGTILEDHERRPDLARRRRAERRSNLNGDLVRLDDGVRRGRRAAGTVRYHDRRLDLERRHDAARRTR